MLINSNGVICVTDDKNIQLPVTPLAAPVFTKVKDITSIYLDNAIKTENGYLFTQESMTASIKQLTNYFKNNS